MEPQISDAKLQEKKQEEKHIEDEQDPTKDVGQDRGEFHNLVDILFVIDATGSMSWCMAQMKKTVKKIISRFAEKQYNIKFAIDVYRDHPPQQYSYVEKHFDLRNEEEILKVIDKECEVGGGGDTPEAVMDGLYQGLVKTSWRISTDGKTKSKRFLFHGCDAPPHGNEYGGGSSDSNWGKNGCPCKITRHDIKKQIMQKEVDYSLIKCGTQVDTMESLFKECFEARFKRVVEIKQQQYKSSKRRARDASVSDSGSEEECRDYEEEQCCQAPMDLMDHAQVDRDMPAFEGREMEGVEKACELKEAKEEKRGFFASLKEKIFGDSKKEKRSTSAKRKRVAAPAPAAMKAPVAMKAMMEEEAMPARKRTKKKKEKKVEKKVEGSDEDDNRSRSMGSLVLSQVEDGLDDYFGDSLKKEKKEKKKRRGSADKIEEDPEKKGEEPAVKQAPVESHTEKLEELK